jgi:hypothetical protein
MYLKIKEYGRIRAKLVKLVIYQSFCRRENSNQCILINCQNIFLILYIIIIAIHLDCRIVRKKKKSILVESFFYEFFNFLLKGTFLYYPRSLFLVDFTFLIIVKAFMRNLMAEILLRESMFKSRSTLIKKNQGTIWVRIFCPPIPLIKQFLYSAVNNLTHCVLRFIFSLRKWTKVLLYIPLIFASKLPSPLYNIIGNEFNISGRAQLFCGY